MTDDQPLPHEEEEYLNEQLMLAHDEFKNMLLHWAGRDAHPISVAVVFCTGLLVNLRGYLSPAHYQYVLHKITTAAVEISDKEEKENDHDGSRTVH